MSVMWKASKKMGIYWGQRTELHSGELTQNRICLAQFTWLARKVSRRAVPSAVKQAALRWVSLQEPDHGTSEDFQISWNLNQASAFLFSVVRESTTVCDLIGLCWQEYQQGHWVILSLVQKSQLSRKEKTIKTQQNICLTSYFSYSE